VYLTFDEVVKVGKENLRTVGTLSGEVTGRFIVSILQQYKDLDSTILLQLSMAVAGSITQYLLRLPPDAISAMKRENDLKHQLMLESLKNAAPEDLPNC